ncbi:hypothetical protein D9615_005550 [Tricholomella constricta]|uniref:Uncharacterized protein n=1 Tax=Tricholomella constricta TaxID=117010 RepID=A0A8H5HEB9_9AGAR|nr:hypothetical protein D9615_005550 [Tricholomella constricta]
MSIYEKLDTSKGLIFVYSDPGLKVKEEDYNDWYDNEHIPSRLNVPGILSSARYRAVDSQSPSWLALYDITSPDVAQSAAYKGLGPIASNREKQIMADLGSINRRVYEHVMSLSHPTTGISSLPGQYIFAVHMKVTLEGEEEFNRWYNEEHILFLSKIPGWLCGRRYKLVESVSRGVKIEPAEDEMPSVDYLAIHELENYDFMQRPAFNAAFQTPWRERVLKSVMHSELRLFERHRVFRTLY